MRKLHRWRLLGFASVTELSQPYGFRIAVLSVSILVALSKASTGPSERDCKCDLQAANQEFTVKLSVLDSSQLAITQRHISSLLA
jgi:hypothetical protein